MSQQPSPAPDVADDIICDAPAGRIDGADAYRAFMGPLCRC